MYSPVTIARVGMLGTYGNRWANLAVGLSDWLLVLGSRLDIRRQGRMFAAFRAGRQIFHVDVEPGELNQRVTGCHAIQGRSARFLPAALERAAGIEFPGRDGWLEEIAGLIERWPDAAELGTLLASTRTASCTHCPKPRLRPQRSRWMWDSTRCGRRSR